MSHCVCLVILPEGTTPENAEDKAADLLEPYDENGNGTRESKWDWWVVGGRWDGWIFGPEHEKASSDQQHGFNFSKKHHHVENNCRPVREIPLDDPHYVPFALLTPDGEWHEMGRLCWFAIVEKPLPEEAWLEHVREVLTKYADHLAVAIDCHV